uniref:F-box domain-containing protein n=1 Tax=Leersia perrieri TaxID=77586 RepID=A0A0D9XHC8_9ORYZ
MSDYINCKPAYKFRLGNNDPFEYLPEDVLCIILSKLPLKEQVRASAVSRKWRCLWTVCPKLNFDSIAMYDKNNYGRQLLIQKFIDSVNAILAQFHGRVVEELSIKCDFDTILIDHLDSWVSFAVMSWTKFLSLDLTRPYLEVFCDKYIFPFKLLDSGIITRLQKLQLGRVSIGLPTQFGGFPNLRRLDLKFVDVNVTDLQDMLSKCCKLEWLNIMRCHLSDGLKVNSPLPCQIYLSVEYSQITEITFNAVKLKTFKYKGKPVPINLIQSSELEIVDIFFSKDTLVHISTLLCNVLINVQKLTFTASCEQQPEPIFGFFSEIGTFYRKVSTAFWFLLSPPPPVQEPIKRLPECPFNYLKRLYFGGYNGSNGQVEFLIHMVENAPALEALTLKQDGLFDSDVHSAARRYLDGKISPQCAIRYL